MWIAIEQAECVCECVIVIINNRKCEISAHTTTTGLRSTNNDKKEKECDVHAVSMRECTIARCLNCECAGDSGCRKGEWQQQGDSCSTVTKETATLGEAS